MTAQPLRRVLTIQSLLAILLPFGIVVLLGLFWILPQIRKDAEERQLLVARAVGIQVESHLETGSAIVRASAAMPRESRVSGHGYQQHFDALLGASDVISSLYGVAADGSTSTVAIRKEQQARRGDLTSLNLINNPLFREISRDKKPRWSETFLSVINGGLAVAYGAAGDEVIVIGEIDLGMLTKFLRQINTEKGLLILVVDHNGQVIADNNGNYTAQQLNISNIPLISSGIRTDKDTTGSFELSGRTMTGSIIQIPGVDWHVVVAKSHKALYGTVRTIALTVLGGIFVALVCGALTSVYMARRLARRFEELTAHAQEIASGVASGNWPTTTIDEFNRLSMNLQEMAVRLQNSETLYRTLFEQLPDGIILFEVPALKPIQFNTAAHIMLGYSREEFSRITVADFEKVQDTHATRIVMEKVLRDGTASFDTVHHTKNGDSKSVFVTLRLIELGAKPMILALHRDVSLVKQSTRTLELYSYALDNARDSIFLANSEACFQFVNNAACESLGYTRQEMLEMKVFAVDADFPCEHWPDYWEQIRCQGASHIETRHTTRDGRYIPVEVSIKFFEFEGCGYVLGMARDLTERKKHEAERLHLEQQMLHAQKLESLGVLAGGIAHDFNNILMAIMGNADLALMRINKESSAVENLHKIEQAAARAADLAKQMLAYSGKGKFVVENIDLNSLLEDMLHMLEVSISKKAILRLNPYHPLPSVEADATQMRQIVMNLVINASEAIGDRSGVIAITTGCMDCDSSYLKDVWLDENISDGLYVYLEIADTGCGMDKDTLAKLFDPFFTTKFTGRGLGMAAVLGIIRGHKGAIKVYSEPGKGTSFKILLPASDRPAELFNGTGHQDDWQGIGTCLLVDDEESVRGIGSEMIKELGFSVLTACDGREAVELFKNHPEITFVVLDLTMPHMDGEQCFRELRQMKPDVRVIMSSGYNEQDVTQRFVGKGLAGFIQKPYRMSVLKEVIKGEAGLRTA